MYTYNKKATQKEKRASHRRKAQASLKHFLLLPDFISTTFLHYYFYLINFTYTHPPTHPSDAMDGVVGWRGVCGWVWCSPAMAENKLYV